MREALEALDRASAFQTLGRFDLLAGDHLPYTELGAADVDAELRKGIEAGEGVIAVAGRMGSGKSSLIAAVANALDQRAAGEELQGPVDPGAALRGMQRLFDIFWKLKRCPVLIVEDTDHWGGVPEVADAFFDQTLRAFGTLDAVTVVAVQTDYTHLSGYLRIRDKLASEVALPRLPNVEWGLARALAHRIESAGNRQTASV